MVNLFQSGCRGSKVVRRGQLFLPDLGLPFQCSFLNVGFSVSLTGPSLSLMDLFLAACTAGDFDLDLERPREAVTFLLEEGGGGERSRGESRRPPAPTVTVKFSPSAMTFLEWGESELSSDFGLLCKIK